MSERGIVVGHYAASDGPRLLLAGRAAADFEPLRAAFVDLTDGEAEFDLASIRGVRFLEIDSLRLRSGWDERGPTARRLGPRDFEWAQAPDDWFESLVLLDVLIVKNHGGHQYVHLNGLDALTVEISLREYAFDAGGNFRG